MIDINTVYARYCLMKDLNYPINWSNLVKATNDEFASIFDVTYNALDFSSLYNQNPILNNMQKPIHPTKALSD